MENLDAISEIICNVKWVVNGRIFKERKITSFSNICTKTKYTRSIDHHFYTVTETVWKVSHAGNDKIRDFETNIHPDLLKAFFEEFAFKKEKSTIFNPKLGNLKSESCWKRQNLRL